MPVEPKYHTAEHILTATIEELYNGTIKEVHFKGKKVRCDYAVKFDIPIEQAMTKIESRVNEIVTSDLEVTLEIIDRVEAEKRMILRKVPKDMDPIRLVKIGSFDTTPCSGEHVKRTGQVGHVEIRTYNQIDEETIRLTFMLH